MSTHDATHVPVDHGTTERELERNLLFGLAVGTPAMFVTVVGLCLLAGLDVNIAMSVALMPSVFSGVFFAGIVPLLGQCARQERFQHEARVAMVVPMLLTLQDETTVAPAVA